MLLGGGATCNAPILLPDLVARSCYLNMLLDHVPQSILLIEIHGTIESTCAAWIAAFRVEAAKLGGEEHVQALLDLTKVF